QHKASLWTALAWGIVIGLSILTRPTFIPPLALLLIGLICSRTFRAIPCWRRAQLLGLTVLAAGLTLLPVMVQSYRHTGEASVLPYSGGINLYIGNNPQSDVTIAMRPGWQWDNLTRLPARFEVPPGRPSSKFFAGQAAAYAREMPADFLLGLWRKSLQLLSPRELPRNIDMYVYRQWSTGLGLMVWKAGPFGFPFGVLLPLAAVGTFMAKRRIPVAITLLSLGYAGAIVLVFVTARYRTPIIPALSIPAAYACVHFWHLGRTRQFVMLTRHLVVMLIISVVISLPGPFPQERNAYEAELHYCLAMQHSRANSLAAAEHELRQALAINPNYADAYNSLGVILERAGDTTQAMSAYSQAVANDASHLTATLNLAGAAYQSGKLEVAADVYAQALALNPQQTTALNRLALIHVKQGQFPLAVERFRQSLGINAQDAAVHNNLGSALNEMKQTDLAIKHFEAAVILAPDMDIAIDNLGAQLTGRGEIGKAIRLYDTVVERAAKLNQRERADRYRVKRDALVQSPASQDVLDTPQSTH
ncbi:MAG: tetratricopeptide repeat protein, partial [Verrucomicrobia bacterium]|nr:tetratricopeptide repeat protein [Verrucomicrobiota bacterium]